MISLATPWIFGAAVVASLATAALHLLSVRRPPSMLLPTMRFLPDRSVRAVSRTTRPSDLLLLMTRVSALLLGGLALAGVAWRPAANVRGQVVIVDRGRGVGDVGAWRAVVNKVLSRQASAGSAGSVAARETRVVIADSSSRLLDGRATSQMSIDTLTTVPVRVSMAGAMLTALRAAEDIVRQNQRVDSVELVIVSPLARESVDEAVAPLRAQWPGRVRVEPIVASVPAVTEIVRAQVAGAEHDDPVAAAMAAVSGGAAVASAASMTERTVVVLRDSQPLTPAGAANTIRVHWPNNGVPAGWTRSTPDTIGAIVVNGHALVAPFVRVERAPANLASGEHAIAWWSDGSVAATERATDGACERTVGVLVSTRGDALVGATAQPFLSALLAPCGGTKDIAPVANTWRETFEGTGALASVDAFRRAGNSRSVLAPWLLAAALVLLGVEWFWRERAT